MKKIGFILNHYDVHQVPHIVPYAFELSRLYDDVNVDLLCSSKAEEDFALAIGKGYENHRCSLIRLEVPRLIDLVDPLLSKVVFARKSFVLSHNAAMLSQYDVLVVPEMTSLALRQRREFAGKKMVFTGHGAGDNRHGGSFNARIGKFDLALMPGRKYLEGLAQAGHLNVEKSALVGYPKLEAMTQLGVTRKKLFNNDRPVVVFNPHHNRDLSCWHKMGRQVLDYFYRSKDYNLVFAPHTVLFKRSWGKGEKLPGKYKSGDNVLVDTGSMSSCDMTYLRSADIYLGDVSSQVYEFLETPRPCVFLNAHETNWKGDPSYRQWTFGPVIEDAGQLETALEEAVSNHQKYRKAQEESFAYTFEIADESAAIRGARAIAALAEVMR